MYQIVKILTRYSRTGAVAVKFCCICRRITQVACQGEKSVCYLQYIQVALIDYVIICHESGNAKLVVCTFFAVIFLF
jgi:hypothetical protein